MPTLNCHSEKLTRYRATRRWLLPLCACWITAVPVADASTTAHPCWLALGEPVFDPAPCQRALEVVSDQTETHPAAHTWSWLAIGYAKLRQSDASSQAIRRATELAPDDAYVLHMSAVALLFQGRYRQARESLDRLLIASANDQPAAWLNRALANRGIGEYQLAEQDVRNYRILMGLEPAENPPSPVGPQLPACEPWQIRLRVPGCTVDSSDHEGRDR